MFTSSHEKHYFNMRTVNNVPAPNGNNFVNNRILVFDNGFGPTFNIHEGLLKFVEGRLKLHGHYLFLMGQAQILIQHIALPVVGNIKKQGVNIFPIIEDFDFNSYTFVTKNNIILGSLIKKIELVKHPRHSLFGFNLINLWFFTRNSNLFSLIFPVPLDCYGLYFKDTQDKGDVPNWDIFYQTDKGIFQNFMVKI